VGTEGVFFPPNGYCHTAMVQEDVASLLDKGQIGFCGALLRGFTATRNGKEGVLGRNRSLEATAW
jgi:hypothetical protein